MYGGHIALGIAAKRWVPIVPVWLLVLAAQLPDWMDVIVCTAQSGLDNPALYSHSLLAVAVLSVIAVLVGRFIYGSWYVARVLALLVISHLLGDYITGVKPTWSGGPTIGLRLYAQPLLDFALEGSVIVWSWWMYRSTFRPANRDGFALRAMLFGLLALQAAADIAFAVVPRVTKCG